MDGLDALKISDEKKRYIVELLNPLLEEMVAKCIHEMPKDPVPYILDYLEKRKSDEEECQLTAAEKESLRKENERLQTQVDKAKLKLHDTVKMAAAHTENEHHDDHSETSSEEGDEPEFMAVQSTRSRPSVSAEAYGEWNKKQEFVAPVITKTDDQKDKLKKSLGMSILFDGLDENDLNITIGAMKEVKCQAGEKIIEQGEHGDFLFVVESGKLECYVKSENSDEGGLGELVYAYNENEIFGELSLLYNWPRQASIVSTEPTVLWKLDRETFSHIVNDGAQKKRAKYMKFLSKVPLLNHMTPDERAQLCDAMKEEKFAANGTIVEEGEEGKKFYIIEEGTAEAVKQGVTVMSYKPGDFFGELALIRHQPRAATVVCKEQCKVLSVDSVTFKRLLCVDSLLQRFDDRYV